MASPAAAASSALAAANASGSKSTEPIDNADMAIAPIIAQPPGMAVRTDLSRSAKPPSKPAWLPSVPN